VIFSRNATFSPGPSGPGADLPVPCNFSTGPCNVSPMNFSRKVCRLPLPAIIAIAAILAYACFFGRATLFVWTVKHETAHDRQVAVIPSPLPDSSISTVPGTAVDLFGYQFEVPWQGPATVGDSPDHGAARVVQPSGQRSIFFFNPVNDRGLVKTLRAQLTARGSDPSAANAYLGAESDYDLERSILYATPNQLSLMFPDRREVFAAARLMIKKDTERSPGAGLYSFKIGDLRGFQFGDPGRANSMSIDAYDSHDRKFEFVIGSKPGPATAITQPEINRLLQTLRPVP